MTSRDDRVEGVLLATAAGDALGAPNQVQPARGPGSRSPWSAAAAGSPVSGTDDTSMAIAIAEVAATVRTCSTRRRRTPSSHGGSGGFLIPSPRSQCVNLDSYPKSTSRSLATAEALPHPSLSPAASPAEVRLRCRLQSLVDDRHQSSRSFCDSSGLFENLRPTHPPRSRLLGAGLTGPSPALARTTPPHTEPGRYHPPDALLAFLEGF